VAAGRASDVDRIEAQMRAARRRHADQRPQEFRIAGDHGGGQPAFADEPRRSVDIGQHRFEQLGALHQAGLERLPFGRFDQQRHMAERPRPVSAGRILVHAVENTGIAQMAIGGAESPADLFRAQTGKHGQQRVPMRAHPTIAVHHLVERAGERLIARQQLLDLIGFLLRGAVERGGHAAIRPESAA
jgi:hypothetical protein